MSDPGPWEPAPRSIPDKKWYESYIHSNASVVPMHFIGSLVATAVFLFVVFVVVHAKHESVIITSVTCAGMALGCHMLYVRSSPWLKMRRLAKIAKDPVWAPRSATVSRGVVHNAYREADRPEDLRHLLDDIERRFAEISLEYRPAGSDAATCAAAANFKNVCMHAYSRLKS